ncbi:dynein light chain Tctex-type 5-B-like [Tubulanus polymorphus]|uniref:dynein light chain Tctex-type 5-B-like n=1 Tax=Tubulanus polymorphus TaxID=672921 RepID=UPI003DA57404
MTSKSENTNHQVSFHHAEETDCAIQKVSEATKQIVTSPERKIARKSEHVGRDRNLSTTSVKSFRGLSISSIMSLKRRQYLLHDQTSNLTDQEKLNRTANTFKMKPDKQFQPEPVERIIRDVLHAALQGKSYDVSLNGECAVLSDRIKISVKRLGLRRYKFVCIVTIGHIKGQGYQMGSKCVWDAENDNYASYTYKDKDLFATGCVFATYYE